MLITISIDVCEKDPILCTQRTLYIIQHINMADEVKVSPSYLDDFLEANSCSRKYFIEYLVPGIGALTNHVSHAAIALFHLGDTLGHFDRFMEHYCKRLEPREGGTTVLLLVNGV